MCVVYVWCVWCTHMEECGICGVRVVSVMYAHGGVWYVCVRCLAPVKPRATETKPVEEFLIC